MFWNPKDTMKDKFHLFSGHTERNKFRLIDLKCKLQEHPIIDAFAVWNTSKC